MIKSYHLCVSSHNEVIFRDREDYIRGLNCLALSLYNTRSTLLADSLMSSHYHFGVNTADKIAFVKSFRVAYDKYFNNKYHRRGPLGEISYYWIELEGVYHTLAAISYILRNPVHHGITSTPFEYPYNSSNCYFPKELGHVYTHTYLASKKDQRLFVSKNTTLPPGYKMNDSGIIVQEAYIERHLVEKMYVSPRSFLYNMNRVTSEEWTKEQDKDENLKPLITLDSIENGTDYSISEMLSNEKGRRNPSKKADIDICAIIDKEIVPQFHKKSYVSLSDREKEEIGTFLRKQYYADEKQIIRCLGMV